ncbi:MAG: hypothetical protein ABII19_01235 [Patescibacteria group bacterium]
MTNVDSGWTPEAKAAAEELANKIQAMAGQEWDVFTKEFFATKTGAMEDMDTIRGPETKERLEQTLDAQIKVQGLLAVGERLAAEGKIGGAESAQKIVQEVRAGEEAIDVEALDKAIKEFEANQSAQA